MALPATIRGLNTAGDPESVRQRVEALEQLLEGLFTIPGTNRKIGLDVILDLVPVAGDVVGAALGGYMIWEARNLGLSKWQMSRMAGNVGIDFLLGLIPWIGAVPDFLFRSNTRNLKIISRALDRKLAGTAREGATSAAIREEDRLTAPRFTPATPREAQSANEVPGRTPGE